MQTTQLFLFLFLFSGLQMHAQYRFDNPIRFDGSDGLPSNHIEDFVEDEYGFIWIATRGGLCRFDGSKIAVLKKTENDTYIPE